MLVDCDRCEVRGPAACGDCVVTVLLGAPPGGVELGEEERSAIDALAGVGLVPPLRLTTGGNSLTPQGYQRSGERSVTSEPRRASGFER